MKLAIVGASGAVGQEFMNILEESRLPIDELLLFGSERSAGRKYPFRGKELTVRLLAHNDDFCGVDIALVSAGGSTSKEFAETITKHGTLMIDNSSAFRMEADVPLVVPEVNPEAIEGFTKRNIIANPNCSTAQMVVALKPLHDRARIKRVVVSTYQSVSGSGKEAMDELWNQTKGLYVPGQEVEPSVYPKQIAFNVIPHIDVFMEDGFTKEEWKMVAETKKILDPKIKLTATEKNAILNAVSWYADDAEKVIDSIQRYSKAELEAAAARLGCGIDELGDFAELEQVSVEALQEIGYAAQLNGSSLEALKASVSGVNKTVGEAALGIGRGAQTFEKLGMAAKNADGSVKSFDQVLEEVAGKMEGLSRQEQIALAEKLGIDRSLIPLLAKGRGELEALRKEAQAFGVGDAGAGQRAGGRRADIGDAGQVGWHPVSVIGAAPIMACLRVRAKADRHYTKVH